MLLNFGMCRVTRMLAKLLFPNADFAFADRENISSPSARVDFDRSTQEAYCSIYTYKKLGCQVLVVEKCQTLFLKKKYFGFYYIKLYRLKKGQLYLFNYKKFRGQPIKKMAKIVIFGLEKANLATLTKNMGDDK